MNDISSLSLEPLDSAAPAGDMDVEPQISDKDVAPAVSIDEQPVQVNWNQTAKDRRILFVDDDERFLNLCHRRFEASEYAIFTASGAEEALQVMQKGNVDVVISDMSMPGKNGAELMQEIERKYPDVIRIIASGKFDLANTIEAINKGHIYKYITKPFNDKDLKLTIYQALLEKERREAEERRLKERQENVKRRARQLGEVVAQTRDKADKAYQECLSLLTSLVTLGNDAPIRISDLAERLAKAAGAAESDCQQVKVAAVLQDVAVVGQPDVPASQMDGEVKQAWLRHPVVSAKLISEMAAFREAAFIVKSHHERYDGTGFPCGLKGEEIPWGARVVALATAYDTVRERHNLSHHETLLALGRISERFDPHLMSLLDAVDPSEGYNLI